MQHRNLREDALQDSAASLRMANGILRELVEAGAVDGDPDDLATLLAATYDEIVGISQELGEDGEDDDAGSSPSAVIDVAAAIRDAANPRRAAETREVLRLTEKRLEALARLIECSIDEPFRIG
jgi:hypothetical protein